MSTWEIGLYAVLGLDFLYVMYRIAHRRGYMKRVGEEKEARGIR